MSRRSQINVQRLAQRGLEKRIEEDGRPMGRRERRAMARNAFKGSGLKGTEKQQAVRALASNLKDQKPEPEERASIFSRMPRGLGRRKSGLIVPQ